MGKGNDFWLDDPEWEILRRKSEKRPVSKQLREQARQAQPKPKLRLPREEPRAQAHREVTDKEVVVNLKLAIPKFRPPNLKPVFQAHRRKIVTAGIVVVIGLAAFGGLRLLSGRDSGEVAGTSNDPSEAAQQEAEAAFNPLVPLENLKDAAGKQSRPEFRFDKEKKVLAYVAEYNGANLTISQQQVPEDFKSDPAKLMSVADSIQAQEKLDTQKGTAYIATDQKSKAQTAVFATDEVLVFVRANKSLDEDEWKFYINQLNPAE